MPALVEAVVGAELQGDPTYDVSKTGAAEASRDDPPGRHEGAHKDRKTVVEAADRT